MDEKKSQTVEDFRGEERWKFCEKKKKRNGKRDEEIEGVDTQSSTRRDPKMDYKHTHTKRKIFIFCRNG